MRQTLLLLLLGTAQGHQPTSSEGETFDIERPTISHAVYGTFHSGDEVFRIELDYETPFAQARSQSWAPASMPPQHAPSASKRSRSVSWLCWASMACWQAT